MKGLTKIQMRASEKMSKKLESVNRLLKAYGSGLTYGNLLDIIRYAKRLRIK